MKLTSFCWRFSAACVMTAAFGPAPYSYAQEPAPLEEQPAAEVARATPAAEPNVPAAAAIESASPLVGDVVIELIQERHPNGAVKIEREMTLDTDGNYVLHGAWRYYDDKGRLLIDGRFRQGQRDGMWRRFYRGNEAALLSTEPYNEFSRPLISTATFHDGQLHGTWIITDSQHRKVHELTFADGQRHGQATWYYPGGGIFLQATYEKGVVNGEVAHLAADGKVIEKEIFENGRKIAAQIEYHDAERKIKKQETTLLYPVVTVKTPDAWETCTLATVESQDQPVRHGPFFLWHPNGQLARQGEFRSGIAVGTLTAWHSNGQKKVEGHYADGKLAGTWTWWHANGQKAVSGEYADSTPTGAWTYWKPTGELAQRTDLTAEKPVIAGPASESLDPTQSAQAPIDSNSLRR